MAGSQRILIVDEDPAMLDRIGRHLCALSYDVRCAANSAEALECCRGWAPELVIVELHLDGMSGIDLAQMIRRELAQVRFILLTPSAEIPQFRGTTTQRWVTYLAKPFPAEELTYYVRRVLQPGESQGYRREYNRYPFNVEMHCILVNPFDDSESRPIPALMRDVSRAGVSMIVRQLQPVPALMKIIFNLPHQQHASTLLAKTVSCTLTQISGVYRLGARFIGLLPPEMERLIASSTKFNKKGNDEDIFMGRSFKDAMREWLGKHHENLPDQLTGLTHAALLRLVAEFDQEDEKGHGQSGQAPSPAAGTVRRTSKR